MEALFDSRDINPEIRRIIKSKARSLVGSAGYTKDDIEDIVQDLIVHLLTHPLTFEAQKGKLSTVTRRILDRKIANLIESRHAQKRDVRRCRVSLDDPVKVDGTGTGTLHDVYDVDSYLHLTEKSSQKREDRLLLGIAVERVLTSLPSHLRKIAEGLLEDRKSEVARDLDIPWSTFCDACAELRKIFAAYDFKENT